MTHPALPSLRARCRRGWEALLGLVYPEVCQICGLERATRAEGYVGPDCWKEVRFIVPPFCEKCGLPFDGALTTRFECSNCREMELSFRYARSAVAAKGLVLDAIHRFKYQEQLWLEDFLAPLLIQAARPELRQQSWDAVVPIPLHPAKERERGYNQAQLLARPFAKALSLPLMDKLVTRVQRTRTQTLLTRKERAANMRGAFALRPSARVRGLRLLLIDDVFTTGATASACARALLKGGATDVAVWTVARGL